MKVLIVEDEYEIASSVSQFLTQNGITVISVVNLFDAEDKLLMHQFDCILLDIGLPDGNGLSFIQKAKKQQENAGILIVSAKNSVDDKITGLDLGADDYITKPFHLTELLSRIKANYRRQNGIKSVRISFNEIDVRLDEQQAYVNDILLDLTKKEYELLAYFVQHPNRVLTKEMLTQHLWGESLESSDNYDFIYTHIKNLRKKILDAKGTDYLKTVYGMGYKFAEQ